MLRLAPDHSFQKSPTPWLLQDLVLPEGLVSGWPVPGCGRGYPALLGVLHSRSIAPGIWAQERRALAFLSRTIVKDMSSFLFPELGAFLWTVIHS